MKKFFVLIFVSIIILGYLYKKNSYILNSTHITTPCEAKVVPIKKSNELYFILKFKNAGIFHNDAELHGISILLSKLLLRKIGKLSIIETEEKLKELGIFNLSSSADEDHFFISFRVANEKRNEAITFLSEIFNPNFSEYDLSWVKEYFPIQINPENSDPIEIMTDKLYQNLYPGHLYGKNQTGSSEAISKITLSDLNKFTKNNLTAENLKVYCAGKMNSNKAKKLLKILLKNLPIKGEKNKTIPLPKTKYSYAKILNENIKDIAGVMIGIRLDNLSKKEKAALLILSKSLFNNIDGTFFQDLKIPAEFSYYIDERKLSSVLILTSFVYKSDLENYLNYIDAFFEKLNFSQYKNLEELQKYYENSKRNKISSLNNIYEILQFLKLPFDDCDEKIFRKMHKKISDKKNRAIVYTISEEKV